MACERFFPLIIQEIVIQVDICGVDVFQVKVVQIQIIQGLQVEQSVWVKNKMVSHVRRR